MNRYTYGDKEQQHAEIAAQTARYLQTKSITVLPGFAGVVPLIESKRIAPPKSKRTPKRISLAAAAVNCGMSCPALELALAFGEGPPYVSRFMLRGVTQYRFELAAVMKWNRDRLKKEAAARANG